MSIHPNIHQHENYMELAVDLACRGTSRVSPNPRVGCVIVKDGEIIGQGYHQEFGGPHAEIMALRDAVTDPAGASAYVTLEPCSIYGKTPPCTRALIEQRIRRVFVGMTDPNPKINGQGIDILRMSGIEVTTGILEDKVRELNKGYIRWCTTGRPWVLAKVAVSSNDFMGVNGQSRTRITGMEAQRFTHALRAGVDVIMIGRNTALIDNPQLTVREAPGRNPARIIVDTHATLPLNLNIFRDQQAETIVACSENEMAPSRTSYCRYLPVAEEAGRISPQRLLTALGALGITTLLIEGGAQLLESFFNRGLIDEVYRFKSRQALENAELKNPLQIDDSWDVRQQVTLGKDELTIAQKREMACLQES